MKAFLNDPKVKEKYLNRVQAHFDADEIIQGVYWEKGRGCGVGCTIEGSDHSRYETELGISRVIAKLEDRIFEGLENGESKEFPVKFLKAIKVGVDLSLVVPKFMLWLLSDPKDGVFQYAETEQTKKAIQEVIDLYKKKLKGKEVTIEEWTEVRRDTTADTAAAAYAYAAAAAYAADAAAYAADATACAAASAFDTAAYKKAKTKHFSKEAKKLLSLLKQAK